ncbi:MAG TPA: PUA domain-containing protein [Natronoarchaeum rubrum]|nr:PUA domain-containing protein [Natronoarchaeum rubrum]
MTDDSGAGDLGDDGDDLRRVADYQFGAGAGALLFPQDDDYEVKRSSSGRPSQVLVDGGRLVTLGVDGRFTLGLEGGRRLAGLDHPKNRVVVGDDSEPFVREGKNTFAKFVTEADPEIRPGDEVLVVHREGRLLAVGRAELSADAMLDFDAGMAVQVRDGADE